MSRKVHRLGILISHDVGKGFLRRCAGRQRVIRTVGIDIDRTVLVHGNESTCPHRDLVSDRSGIVIHCDDDGIAKCHDILCNLEIGYAAGRRIPGTESGVVDRRVARQGRRPKKLAVCIPFDSPVCFRRVEHDLDIDRSLSR